MATSTLFDNLEITDPDGVKKFVDMFDAHIQKTENERITPVTSPVLTRDEVREFICAEESKK